MILYLLLAFTLLLSLINFGVLWVMVGKVFFSSHAVEYRPIEELARIRQELGLEPQETDDMPMGGDFERLKENLGGKSFVEQVESEVEGEEDDELRDFLTQRQEWMDAERAVRRRDRILGED